MGGITGSGGEDGLMFESIHNPQVPEEIKAEYPIVGFQEFASHVVLRGISAVGFVRSTEGSDGVRQWPQRESYAKVSLVDREGFLPKKSGLPVSMVPFGDGDYGFASTGETSVRAGNTIQGFTIGDFISGQTAVRPVSWHEAHQRKLRFSYDDGYSGLPGLRQRAVLAATRFSRSRQLEKSRTEIDRLVTGVQHTLIRKD